MRQLIGILHIKKYGYGFIDNSGLKKSVKVSKKDIGLNYDGSEVKFEIIKETDKSYFARILTKPDYKNRIFCGIIHHFYKHDAFVYNVKLGKSNLILCKLKRDDKYKENDLVKFKITKTKDDRFYGKIIKKFGDFNDDKALTEFLITSYNLPTEFPKKVLKKANKSVNRYNRELTTERENRKDLTKLITFTIDPERARDLDDAISISKTEEGYKVHVHIADVTYFVRKNVSIDVEAIKRSFSVYLPATVIRMLPPILSENHCSLLPNGDKYAVTTEIDIDDKGEVIRWDIYKSIINSCCKFAYEEVFDILENNKNVKLLNELKLLKEVAKKVSKKRLKLPQKIYNEKTRQIDLVYSDYSHSMIEEMMILNNSLVARTLNDRDIKYPARYHQKPDVSKNSDTMGLLSSINNISVDTSIDKLQKIVDCENEEIRLFNLFGIQRLLTKAKYSIDTEGHWALNLLYYSHFTSPIRRMPDIISHRLIFGEKYKDDKLNKILDIINDNELNYQKIDFLMDDFKLIRFLKKCKCVGNIYQAIVTRVNNQNITVFIPKLFYIYEMHISDFSKKEDNKIQRHNIITGMIIKLKLERIISSFLELKFHKVN